MPLNPLHPLPIPPHFDPEKVSEVWRVPYQERAAQAKSWAEEYGITPSSSDSTRLCLVVIDVQNTFCIPGFELFVAGRSGNGAVDDNRRLCKFIYRNLATITQITATLDTHHAMQIFHSIFLVDDRGDHPPPMSLISEQDILSGRWKFNTAIADSLEISPEYGQEYLVHYTHQLSERKKYELTVWPYHVMLGSIGHALVSAVEEAIFFHGIARSSWTEFEVKGDNPLTEHYSAVGPEVLEGPDGKQVGQKNKRFLQKLKEFDRVVIAGQAKSHCVAWTIDDLLNDILQYDPQLVKIVYLLNDCSSAVVVPGLVDYTDEAEAAFKKFAEAGMNIINALDDLRSWPG
jgi:nicotinamidase-related amidase